MIQAGKTSFVASSFTTSLKRTAVPLSKGCSYVLSTSLVSIPAFSCQGTSIHEAAQVGHASIHHALFVVVVCLCRVTFSNIDQPVSFAS